VTGPGSYGRVTVHAALVRSRGGWCEARLRCSLATPNDLPAKGLASTNLNVANATSHVWVHLGKTCAPRRAVRLRITAASEHQRRPEHMAKVARVSTAVIAWLAGLS
jgi:hypothetical protein